MLVGRENVLALVDVVVQAEDAAGEEECLADVDEPMKIITDFWNTLNSDKVNENILLDNDGDIDYEQLYAQVLYEIREEKAPYWFNNDEVARIQELNMEFMQQQDMAEMVKVCFRKPAEGETANPLNTTELLEVIQLTYPSVVINHKNRVLVGCAMQERGYEQTHPHNIAHYKAIPLKAA